ncbi:MAG: cytochrome c maturation protein CcmE [Arenicellales bacterium]|nr:cytochrome c maturation protein CcmE [Arenicellales bacterium]
MRRRRRNRLLMVVFLVLGIGVAVAFTLNAFRQNILFFFTPSQVVGGEAPLGHPFRIGGLVAENSVQRSEGSLEIHFQVTDTVNSVKVVYEGILPDLFREGQGIVTKGTLDPTGVFVASEVLAKHDENYMPPEAEHALKAAQTLKDN